MPSDKTQKNLSGLHNTLETMGYSVPNIDQFAKDMRKEENLRSVYDKVSSGGYELPDFETFKADMGWIKPTPAGVPTPLRPKDQLAPTGKPDAPATPFGFDLSANPKKPSHAPKARLGFPRLDKKMRPVQEVNDPSVPLLKTTRDVAQDENGNVVNVVQPDLVPDFDPNNGGVTAPKALLDVTTGKAIRPTELSKEEVDGYNAGNIDAVKDPKLRQALKEANVIYTPDVDMEKVHRDQVRDLEQEIDADLKTAYDSFTDKAAAKAKDTRNLMRFGLATAGASMGGGATTMGMHANPLAVESDPEIYMLKLAKHNIQDAKNYIAEADHNAQEGTFSKWLESSFAGGAARGFAQKLFDARTWDMGIGDAGEAASIKAAVNKADLGEKLTPAEDKLLQSMVTKMAVEAYFNSQVGHGYTAGSVSAYSVPFMLEMAVNPVSTSGNAIGAKLMRYAVRKFGLNVAGKALRKKAVKAAVKYGIGGLTSAAVSSAALTATSGTAHVAADAVSRNTGDLKFDYKADPETGELRAQYSGHEEGDDALTATGKAFFMRFMENFSEYSGEALAPIAAGVAKGVGAGAKAAGKAIASHMGKAGAKILDAGRWGTKAARELIDNISASEFGRTITALEKKAHYNGKVLEFAEEKISDLASVLIGDKDLSTDKGKGFFNLDDNIDTFLGVSLTGGVISAAQTAGYFAGGGARGMARYQIGQSEGAVWSTLTTDEQRKAWDDVRRQILLQDGKEQVDAVKSALTNPNFNAEQRRAILDYTKSVQTYKGMSEYRRKQSEDTKADPLQNELADSYDKGAGMTEAEEMSHARSWYEFTQQKATERLGVDAEALDEMGAPDQLTLDQVAQLREEHNEQAVQSYVDYLNARATYEGMIGSVSQGIQAEAAQAEQAVSSQQHKDGTLRRATLRGTEGQNVEVHIKDGDLVMDEEGRIDTDKSSKDFIVRDNETGVVRFASIDDIISAEQPTSADDAVSEAVNAVYERREKEAADAINGTITPQVGAVYNLLDADGNPQQIAIQQVGQDGTLDVDYSGVPHRMTTDELQSMADNTRARQIENEHAAQVQQAKAEEREEREQAGLPRYALNDELTIRTPEGEEVTAYVTNEEDADGNIEVYFNEPFDGKKVHLFTKDYLDGVVVGTRLSPETNTSAGAVEAPAAPAAPALAQVQQAAEEEAPTPTPIHNEEENDIIGRSMTEEEAEAFLTAISNNHEIAPELELTPENWYAEFGEDGMVHTPIGDAHMGENQFLKMMRDGRKSKLGMIRPTLEAPHAIVEEPSMAKEGQETERDSSYIYIRVFEKEDGSRHYHFTSVSVLRDGGEVVVSNQEKSRNQVKRLLTEGVVLWMRADNAPDTSDVDQDLYSSQGTELSDPASEGTDASQSTPSESKDNESTSHADPNDESLSPEEAYEAVLRAANGDAALALEVIKSTITDKEKALTKAKKAKPRSANTIDGKIQALAEVASGIEAAETSLAHWQAVGEIAAEQVQEEAGEVAEPVAEQTEQEAEEPTTEPAPAEEETTEEQEPEEEQKEEVAPEVGDTQASETTGEGYRLSAIAAKRGGNFFENNEGSIDLVKISDNVFEAIGIKPLPMRMTEAMAQHIIKQHAKELGISTQEEAVAFVVDIMQNFDHVREGNKPNTYIFSIEKGRSRTGKRAVTLVLPSKSGEYLGVSSSGYEKVSRLKERALLWEEGANNEAPTTETASANVTSPSATQGGMTGGSASNQSNALSQGKDSEKNTAEGEANDGNQDNLSIEEKEALLSKAKQELEEKEDERTAVAEQAIAIMKDYYDSGAIPGMDSGEFHGQATLILIGFKDRSNLELMKAPGLSELLPSLYKLADEARAKKMLVRKYEKELSQAKEVEGETLTHDKAIRDELVNTMRDAGIEVITDEAEGQAVLDAVHAGEAQMQRAYHGTDADFEAFDHSHMGEGAGGQAYGWGSYFTEEEGVARSYAGGGFVYEAELPDDTGSNYLHFESKPSNKDIARVKRELVKYILRNDEEGMYDYPQGKDDLTQEVDDAGEPTTWRDLYGTVSSHLGSDKEASAFFHSIGYVGIQYNSSEADGGKKNLVIFDESDISIQSKVRLFKTSSGEVYGFVKDGKIYLDLKHATAETAIHEYTHLWASALRRVNPRAWKSIRKQLKGFELWADIASRYPELKGDEDALADEVLAQYSGKRGAQRIEEEMKKAENATDLVGKARVLAAFNSLKEALKTFWTEVADFFGMDYYKSVEDAADKAMSDLMRGVNPNAVEAKEETTKKKPTKKATAKKETATSSVIAPDSERYNGYIVTLPKSGKAGAEVGNIEEFVGADEMREGLMVVYQAPEGFAVASNGTMAIADKTQFDVYKKGKAYKLDGTTIDAGAWKPLKDKWQSFISTETRGEHSDPFTESPVNVTRLSKYLDRVEQDLYNRWKYAKSEGLTRDSFKAYRSRALVSIPNGRGEYVSYPYTDLRTIALAAKRLGVTSFFVEGDLHFGSSEQPGRRLVGNGRLGSVVHAGYFETRDPNVSKRKELSYLYDESVGVKDTDEGVRMQKGDEVLSLQETSDAINVRFNEELKKQIEGTLPKGHIYSLGMPSNALRSAGVPNLPIELTARRLATKASQEYHSEHPFELSDIQNLPQAIAHPIAVFDSSTRSDSTVVLTELQDSRGVNFVVALRVVKSSASRSLEIDVNGIRSIYPKDRVTSILKWITSGKMLWVDKKKALSWITTQLPNAGYDSNATESLQDSEGRLDKQRSNSADVIKPKLQASDGEANKQRSNSAEVISHPQEDGLSKTKIAQQRTNLADVDYLDLDNATKVVETFDNPPLASEDLEIINDNQASEDNDEEVRYRSSRLSPELQAIKDQAKADGSFMKAPNGRPTNLTEKQWLQVRTPEFKEWFGDWENDPTNASKVVDENGEPMVVYHGTSVSSRRFFKFKDGAPNWFTPSEYYAKAFTFDEDIPVMYPSFIKIKKLLYLGYIDGDVISGKIRSLSLDTGISESSIRYIVSKERADKVYQITNSPLFKREAVALGYDGMMAFEAGVDSFAVFSPSQVKSATENTGSFDGMNDDIRYNFHNAVEQDDLDIQDLEEVATSMAEVLGEDVRIIHDAAEIEGRNESETNRMRGAKGWYDPKTGQVVVVLPNAESADDVEATILHEVVGHKGLQELVGKDQFGKFLDEVFEGANEAVRNGIVERSKRYGWNTRLATEEYIAELAEQGFKDLEARDLWNVVRNAFYNILSRVKLALGWNISDRELRYMLWRTYQMKKGDGLMGQAKDIAMQEKLGVGNYEEARFRQGEIAPVKVAATYDALIQKSSYQTQEALQDSMLSLKKAMEMIMQAKGDAKYIEEIEGYQNAYMGENRVSSVNQAEAAAYSRMALEPLVEEVSRLAKKAHHSYVTDYMMAKHGLERNRVMAFQKAVEADVDAYNKAVKESGEGEELTASSLWDAYLNDTDRLRNEADYREGRITADVWHKTDDEIRARYAPSYAEYRERDYAGLTGLLDRPDVDIQTLEEEAIEEVMKFEQENDVTDLWDLTNKATDAPLSKQYEGGLMSRETLEHVRNMYGYYIPLRGFDETTSDEAYSYLGDRDRAFSPTLKKAKGRSSKAEDPLAHIASMMESAILQSNRNKLVRQKFLNFVENNPSDLFSVQKLWVQWNNTTKTWDAVLPEFDPNDTSEEVIRKTQEFEEAMRKSQRENPELFKLASEQPSIPYRVVGKAKEMQHQIIVKRGGRDIVITVNGDPRVAMAVNGLTNPDGNVSGDIGPIFKAGAALNRKLAGYYTSLSPNFVVKNFIRDIIYANTIAWVKESPTYAMTYHANVAKLAGQMHRLVHLYEHDKLDMSNETHRAFKLFMANGGETGYSQLRSMDRHKKEIERMMKESGGRISPKQAFRLLGDTMEFANRGIEDLSRFAAFLTSRQMGRTIDRSIYDAKEMTVNFNKKGAGSTFHDAHTQTGKGKAAAYLSGTGRSLYLFWNVSIQGSVNIARAVKRNPKKGAAYLATFLALGILQTVLPALTGGDDDDRYWNLPDYVRRNNICFFVGDVLVKIPLPQEARAIFGIGELGMSYMSGKEDKDAWMVAYTIAGQLSQIMPLDLMDDSGPIHALTPSIFKPAVEALTNHSWMGSPIWKDTDYNKAMPDWTKAYKSTGGVYVWLTKELNALSGGDDYKQGRVNINPAQLEYLLKGYFGGLYTAADQIIKSSETAFGDREFSMRDVPILSGFLDGADERNDMRNVNNTYYHFKEEAKEVLRLGKSYESDLEQGKSDSTDYAKKLDELVNTKSYERALLFEDLSKEIEEMQKALKEATDPKEAEELQAEIDKQKKALVNQLRQMK
jgi:putative uncharacterized protein (fragment)